MDSVTGGTRALEDGAGVVVVVWKAWLWVGGIPVAWAIIRPRGAPIEMELGLVVIVCIGFNKLTWFFARMGGFCVVVVVDVVVGVATVVEVVGTVVVVVVAAVIVVVV